MSRPKKIAGGPPTSISETETKKQSAKSKVAKPAEPKPAELKPAEPKPAEPKSPEQVGTEEKKDAEFFPLKPRVFEPDDFLNLAQLLLNHAQIVLTNSKTNTTYNYSIIELECYLKNEKFEDHYTHCDPDQKQFACWYFHRSKPGGPYKAGTFKGLDLTLGHQNGYFGILIRSIRRNKYGLDNPEMADEPNIKDFVVGPCNVVNQILQATGFDSIAQLVVAADSNDVRKNKFVRLKFTKEDNGEFDIYNGPRIGLGIGYPALQAALYRFTSYRLGFGFKKATTLEKIRTTKDAAYKNVVTKLSFGLDIFN